MPCHLLLAQMQDREKSPERKVQAGFVPKTVMVPWFSILWDLDFLSRPTKVQYLSPIFTMIIIDDHPVLDENDAIFWCLSWGFIYSFEELSAGRTWERVSPPTSEWGNPRGTPGCVLFWEVTWSSCHFASFVSLLLQHGCCVTTPRSKLEDLLAPLQGETRFSQEVKQLKAWSGESEGITLLFG